MSKIRIRWPWTRSAPTSAPHPIDLDALSEALHQYDHLDRFGGQYWVVLSRIYRISRQLVVSILNDHGDVRADRTDQALFDAASDYHPEYAMRLRSLLELQVFLDCRGRPWPFETSGQDAREQVVQRLSAVSDLLDLAYRVGGTEA